MESANAILDRKIGKAKKKKVEFEIMPQEVAKALKWFKKTGSAAQALLLREYVDSLIEKINAK